MGSIEFKEQQLELLVTSATKMYAGQNNEHDYLDYGYASLDGLVSINRLSAGCGTRRKDSLVMLPAYESYPCGLNNAATARILANPAVIPI